MNPILEELDASDRRLLRRRAMPTFVPLMLATLAKSAFSDPAWVFEAKLDGQRSLLWRRRSTVRLITRNEKDRTSHYPDLVEAILGHEAAPMIADGEIVAFHGDVTSFSRLQERMQNSRPTARQIAALPVVFYLFDLMWFDGYDLSALPLLARKSVLRRAIVFGDTIRFSEHLDEEGEVAFRAACEKGWEGLIAKRASAPYTHGRSKDWLKFKCVNEQEFVVLGWTDPHGARSGLGALLVGYYEDGELRYTGRVGTGFTESELDRLEGILAPLERSTSPFKGGRLPKTARFVEPELVCSVEYLEWTQAHTLRAPSYKGLRDDIEPAGVVFPEDE
jgi:bifunctional non-homologous end joining protein LigD